MGGKFHVTTSAEPGTEIGYRQEGTINKGEHREGTKTRDFGSGEDARPGGEEIAGEWLPGLGSTQNQSRSACTTEMMGWSSPMDTLVYRHSRGRRYVHRKVT